MSKRLNVDDVMYPVVENMGYNHSIGMYSVLVKDGDKERVVVWHRGGPKRFWGPKDRISGHALCSMTNY